MLEELHPCHVGCMRSLIPNLDPVALPSGPRTPCRNHDQSHWLDVQPARMELEKRGLSAAVEWATTAKECTGCVDGCAVRYKEFGHVCESAMIVPITKRPPAALNVQVGHSSISAVADAKIRDLSSRLCFSAPPD